MTRNVQCVLVRGSFDYKVYPCCLVWYLGLCLTLVCDYQGLYNRTLQVRYGSNISHAMFQVSPCAQAIKGNLPTVT